MAVKVLFEVGHTSKLKSKLTPDGFTHDWELYVRGTDKNDISHFVEKVVFNLHESFPKPKRGKYLFSNYFRFPKYFTKNISKSQLNSVSFQY